MNIPGYQLGREIAAGEYCSLYSALEIATSKTVTVKYFHPNLSSSNEFCLHVRQVSERLLDHPLDHMVRLKKVVWNSPGCFLITDYFPCGVNQQLPETSFTIEEALNYGWQIAATLTRLHRLGLVHGGVSSANLVFSSLSDVTLGLVAFQRTLKDVEIIRDLPLAPYEAQYIAPEFDRGLKPASDFYSLGVVLFELMFKRSPFDGQSPQQLLLQKLNRVYSMPHGKKLAPLFDQLLNPDPDQRVDHVDDYLALVEQCGFHLQTEDASSEFNEPTEPMQVPVQQSAQAARRKIPFIAGAIVLILIGVALLLFSGQETAPTARFPIEPAVSSIAQQAVVTVKPAPATVSDAAQRARRHLQLAQKQLAQNNYGAALMTVDKALKEDAGLSAARQLKRSIEQEIETRASLKRAEKLIQQGRIVSPPGDNALQTYRQLAQHLPAGDTRAQRGLMQLADRYYRAADALVLNEDYAAAREQIAIGLRIAPDHAELQKLALYIRQQERLAAEQQKQKLLAQQQAQKQQRELEKRRNEELARQRQQQLQQQEQARLLAQQQRARAKAEQQARLQQQQARQRQLIDHKLAQAQRLLSADQLSQQSLSRALSIHGELTGQTLPDERIPALFDQIVASYGKLAQQQLNRKQLQPASVSINRGLSLEPGNRRLLKIKNRIEQEIIAAQKVQQAQQKKKQPPIIGTF